MSLSGRKRFLADLDELKSLSRRGWEIQGIQVKGFKAGDDEGGVQFSLSYEGDPISSAHLYISDTSSYPKDHTCYAYSEGSDDAHETVAEVLENVASASAKPLKETITRLVNALASALGLCDDDMNDEDDEDDPVDEDHYGHEIDDVYQAPEMAQQTTALRKDFVESVAYGLRPGLVRFGCNEFVVCVSSPLTRFDVPPTHLASWDRRLIMPEQHLTLLISGFRGSYPPLSETGAVISGFTKLKFLVGLSAGKPSKEAVEISTRDYGLKEEEIYIPEPEPEIPEYDENDPDTWQVPVEKPQEPEIEPVDPGRFEKFSLSTSLNSLLNDSLIALIQLRIKFGIGWAGAEKLLDEQNSRQISAEQAYGDKISEITRADHEEAMDATLPPDPFSRGTGGNVINLPMVAYSYLIRRFMLCARFCLVCHQRIRSDFVALKPYVCDKGLCAYQFYALSFGTSIEYEILHNTAVVDLLVSFACNSAAEGQLQEMPTGIGLRVPPPSRAIEAVSPRNAWGSAIATPTNTGSSITGTFVTGPDGLVDFDELSQAAQRGTIVEMLNKLPKVSEMKAYLLRKTPGSSAQLRQNRDIRLMQKDIPIAAWTLLRWSVASCTAYIEEMTSSAERLQGLDAQYHQFRFSVASPQAEAKFKVAVEEAKRNNSNAKKYPTLWAWHGSALSNWHSIIRQGLHFNNVVNGRAFGNGVYFAKDGNVSMGYSRAGSSKWKNSELAATSALAIAEIVNLPQKFVSTNPYLVVAEVSWISTRYLLVGCAGSQQVTTDEGTAVSFLKQDSTHPFTLHGKPVNIPLRTHYLEAMMERNRREYRDPPYDEEDEAVFRFDDHVEPAKPPPPIDDWRHDPKWLEQTDYHLLDAPTRASPMSTMHLQKEFKYMMDEQSKAHSLRELGYYISPELMGDNLFQWIVELHSFDPSLPLAQDMAKNGINSLLFEIRYPPDFPHAPPFFRLIKPRLLPFLQGGGGHVTAGGSICMDLLVQDGWLPSYNIAAVLLQIRMAISSTEPRPARLANGQDWKRAYGVQEALDGFTRAAATHGWKVPAGTRQLVLR